MRLLNVLERTLDEHGLSEQDALEIVENLTGLEFQNLELLPIEIIQNLIDFLEE